MKNSHRLLLCGSSLTSSHHSFLNMRFCCTICSTMASRVLRRRMQLPNCSSSSSVSAEVRGFFWGCGGLYRLFVFVLVLSQLNSSFLLLPLNHWTKIQTDDAITITIKLEFDEPKYPSVLVNSQNLSIFQRFQILIINIIIKHKIWTGNLTSPYSVFTSLKLSELIIFCHCGRYNVIWNDSSLRLYPKYLN